MKFLKLILISVVLILSACASKGSQGNITNVSYERAPVFCEHPVEPPELPDVPYLGIQDVREFANERLDAYCAMRRQYAECLRITTGGLSTVRNEPQCVSGDS